MGVLESRGFTGGQEYMRGQGRTVFSFSRDKGFMGMWTLCKGSTGGECVWGEWQSKEHDLVSLILLKRREGDFS